MDVKVNVTVLDVTQLAVSCGGPAASQGSSTDLCVTATSADATETELHDEWHTCDRTGRGEQLPSTTVAVDALVSSPSRCTQGLERPSRSVGLRQERACVTDVCHVLYCWSGSLPRCRTQSCCVTRQPMLANRCTL